MQRTSFLPTCALRFPRLLDHALGHVDIFLEQPAPGGDVDVHLLGTRHLPLLAEDLPLATQLWLTGDERVQELDLGKRNNVTSAQVFSLLWYHSVFVNC